jgi:hypothetical protein
MLVSLAAFSFLLLSAQGLLTGDRITGSVTNAISGAPISGGRVTLMMVVDVPEEPSAVARVSR